MSRNTNAAKKACAAKLKKMASQLIAEDRRQAMAAFNISYVTVGRYLKGNVGNLALSLNLLNFLRSR